MSQHVVSNNQICGPSVVSQITRRLFTKERYLGIDPFPPCDFGHIRRRFYPKHRDATRNKVLQKISIITGDLHNSRVLIESEAIDHHVNIGPSMCKP